MGLLCYDANDRISFEEFFQHPFIKSRRTTTKDNIEVPKEAEKVVQKVKVREIQPIAVAKKEVVIVKPRPPPVPPKPQKPHQIFVKPNEVNVRPKQAILPLINDSTKKPIQFQKIQPLNGNNNLVKLKVHVVHVKRDETKMQKIVK
jgi:hypothetical protein